MAIKYVQSDFAAFFFFCNCFAIFIFFRHWAPTDHGGSKRLDIKGGPKK